MNKTKNQNKRVLICAAQVPFERGGAEILVESLKEKLIEKANVKCDIVSIPYKWYPFSTLLRSMRLWSSLDLEEMNGKKIDLVICTKFPSYFINHHNKVLWLTHQYRQAYDLLNTEYSGFNMKKISDRFKRAIFVYKDTKALKSFQNIFTISKNCSKRLKQFCNIDSQTLYHPSFLKDENFPYNHGDYILSVGRIDKLKRIESLIESLPYTKNQEIKCYIVGKGKHLDFLKNLTSRLNLEKRVIFLGFVTKEKLIELYGNSLAVYYSPLDEDYGYVTLEAFLAKKAVITAKDSGETLEFVKDNETGLIFDINNSKELAEKIDYLYNNKDKALKLGQNGYELIKNITWDHVITTLLENINE